MVITSTSNINVKRILALRESKERRESRMTIIDGARELERAFQSGVAIKTFVYCKKFFSLMREEDLLKKAQALRIECLEVNESIFAKIAFGDRLEGVLAIAQTPTLSLSQLRLSRNPILVVLESIEKPGNLGAILRSCDAAGVEAVFVCDPRTDLFNPNVIRASTGIIFSLPVIVGTAQQFEMYFKENKIKIVAAVPKANQTYTKVDYRSSTAFVLGSEDKGLSSFWMSKTITQVSIPMKGTADSLNVSVSTALLLYEALRQRSL